MESPVSSKSCLKLPSDVWLHIIRIGSYTSDTDKFSLASVNRFLREISLPVLFNPIVLYAYSPRSSRSPSSIVDDDEPCLEHVVERIRGINSSPHILNVIHQLKLINWSITGLQDGDEDIDMCSDSTDEEDEDSSHSSYRALSELISNVPNLYHFDCHNCILPPKLFSQVRGISSLRTLRLYDHSTPSPVINSMELQAIPSSLHVFEYHPLPPGIFSTYGPYEDDIFKIFIHLAGQFTVCSFPIYFLPDMLANNNLTANFPKLQKLSLFELEFDNDLPDAQYDNRKRCIYKFLESTPGLRELRILGDNHPIHPLTFSPTFLPSLEILTAPTCIANDIVKGRALKKLQIFMVRSTIFPKTYTVISKEIEHIYYDAPLEDPEIDLPHLARVFPNATTLVIRASSEPVYRELLDAVISILPKFPRLKKCIVSSSLNMFREDRYRSYCPVGRIDDPKYRSHPTLEDVQILSWSRWVWDSEIGWHTTYSDDATIDLRERFFESYIGINSF